jgi:hypothetical protein
MFKRENAPSWVCAVITLWQIVQQIIWRREDLSQPLPSTHEIEFWASNGLLVAALVGSVLFGLKAQRGSFKPSSGLVIRSAYYGIGGPWWKWWAYKNATDILRACVKNGAIDIVVSNTMFSDPFKGDLKHLLVRYSYQGITDQAVVPEGQRFSVPAKVETEGQRLNQDIEADLIASLSEIERRLYQAFRSEFTNLPWSQKIALKKVCSLGVMPLDDLKGGLDADGFATPEFITTELVHKGFLESHRGVLKPQATKARWMGVLFEKTKLC